jgi:hypothetical protein
MYVPWFTKPETEKKVLQIVNLSPNESVIEKLTDVHPMKQIFWASIVQVCVFGFMMLSFAIINTFVQ